MSLFHREPRGTETAPLKAEGWLRSRHASLVLAMISFTESVFLPIIIDPFLVAMILLKPVHWRRYTMIAVAASTVGGILAYWLGSEFFDVIGVNILEFYGLEERFADVSSQVDASGFVFVLLGAFTPVPYKIVALASGVLQINFFTFLVASMIGRTLRLGLVGLVTRTAGPHALPVVRRYLYEIALMVGIILTIYLLWQFFK